MIHDLLLLAGLLGSRNVAVSPFLTSPSVANGRVAFLRAGDIWVADLHGSMAARRITETPFDEASPKLSRNGELVAFTGPSRDVYVVPASGGQPKRLTFSGSTTALFGWTNDDKIAYRSYESAIFPDSSGLSFIRASGGQSESTGVQMIGFASFVANSDEMLYTPTNPQTGLHAKFQGGQVCKIRTFNLKTGKYKSLENSKFSHQMPVAVGSDVYFLSTEGGSALNLYRLRNGSATRITDYVSDGVRSLSSDGRTVVYECQGTLFEFDPTSGSRNPVSLRFDDRVLDQKVVSKQAAEWVADIDSSPSLDAVAVMARGEILVAEKGKSNWENITSSPSAKDELATWNHDGSHLAYMTDENGTHELKIWNRKARITQNAGDLPTVPRWMAWSPRSDVIYYRLDRRGLYRQDLKSGKSQLLMETPLWTVSQAMSPDGRYIALVIAGLNKRTNLFVFDTVKGTKTLCGDLLYEDLACAFSPDGAELFFLSRRSARVGAEAGYQNMTLEGGVNLIKMALKDEIGRGLGDQGFSPRQNSRLIPTEGRNYTSLSSAPSGFVLQADDDRYFLDAQSMKVSKLQSHPNGNEFSTSHGLSVTTLEGRDVKLFAGGAGLDKGPVAEWSLDTALTFDIKKEWAGMFWDASRITSEKFYDPTLQGLDWKKLSAHYASQLPRIESRSQLTNLISRLVGELTGGHNSFWSTGDVESPPSVATAPGLGMTVSWDGKGARIDYVCRGRRDVPYFGSQESDLFGVAQPGDYVVSVNGESVSPTKSIEEMLVGKPIGGVVLGVSSTPSREKERLITLSENHRGSRYFDFLDRTREYVEKASNGKIGYVHVFDTNSQGISSFANEFSAQSDKRAFILDARWNRGGNSNPGYVEALGRIPSIFEKKRFGDMTMEVDAITGPKVLLVNNETVSGGDILAYIFKRRGIGPLVGTTTSGRTIGVQAITPLIDGATLVMSESQHIDVKSGLDIGENVGIVPDYFVEIPPRLKLSGEDPQLHKAVEILMKKLGIH